MRILKTGLWTALVLVCLWFLARSTYRSTIRRRAAAAEWEKARSVWEEGNRMLPWGGVDGLDRKASLEYFESERGKSIASQRLEWIFSKKAQAVMKRAAKVETYRIMDTRDGKTPGATIGAVEQFALLKRGKDQGADFARRLTSYLLDGRLYFLSPDCITDPGVGYWYRDGKDWVFIAVCYECYHISVTEWDADEGSSRLSGSFLEDFFGRGDPMPGFAKESFPDDTEIQALK